MSEILTYDMLLGVVGILVVLMAAYTIIVARQSKVAAVINKGLVHERHKFKVLSKRLALENGRLIEERDGALIKLRTSVNRVKELEDMLMRQQDEDAVKDRLLDTHWKADVTK